MARRSIISDHEQREAIEAAIRAGVSDRNVAAQFGIKHHSTVAVYRRKLLAEDEEKCAKTENMSEGELLVRRLDGLADFLHGHLRAIDTAETPRLDKTTLDVLKEARQVVREIANLKGLLKPGIQIGIQVNNAVNARSSQRNAPPPEVVKTTLFRVLQRFPEARDALAREFDLLQADYDQKAIEHNDDD